MKKDEIESMADNMVVDVLEGRKDSFEAVCNIDFQIKVLEAAKEKIKEQVVSDLGKEGGKKDFGNYKIELLEVAVKYLFENTKHPRYLEVVEMMTNLNEEKKEIESFLKTVKSSTELIVEDEVVILHQIPKTSKTSFKMTLK